MAEDKKIYRYGGRRVTKTEYEDIQKEVAKLESIAIEMERFNKMPLGERLKHQSEINILQIRRNNANFWINKIINNNKSKTEKLDLI